MRITTVLFSATLLAILSGGELEGQGLLLKRELPPLPSNACEARGYVFGIPASPTPDETAEAEALASEAGQATILGQYERARSLLAEAVSLNPTSGAISYSFGRLLEGGGEPEAALSEYCRFLGIDTDAAETGDVEERVQRIGTEVGALGVSPARAAFEEGVAAFDREDFDEAVLDFSRALVELPEWDQAHFNRAVAYFSSGSDAAGAADLQFYLELSPEASDRAEIEELLEEIGPVTVYSPSTALVSGLLIPGMGYFYSGRPGAGILALGAAGAAAGFAVLHKEVQVNCLVPPVNGTCPPGEAFDESEERPLLVPGLAAAAVITIFGAIHASRGARQDAVQFSAGGGLEGSLSMLSLRGADPVLRVEPTYGVEGGGLRAELEVRF